jgi:hypothetical protein
MVVVKYLFSSFMLAFLSIFIYRYFLKYKDVDENGANIYTPQTVIGLWTLVVIFSICSVFSLIFALSE